MKLNFLFRKRLVLNNTEAIRVLLVDDHAVVRAGYTFLLKNVDDIDVVAEAPSGAEAVVLFVELYPDVVVMDLTMPDMDGLKAIKEIKALQEDAQILVFTMHESTSFVERALQAGALGYISKNSSPEVLIAAIRKIAAGEIYVDSEIAQNMVVRRVREKNSPFSGLSNRQFQIFCRFAEAHSIEDIAEEFSLSTKTVANNLTHIKEKLQVASTAELVRLAISEGLVSI